MMQKPETNNSARSTREVAIEKWVYGGRGLARLDGQVVFVPFVLPGLILAAIWASAWLRDLAGVGQRGRARATSAMVACFCVASLLIPATLTNLGLGSTSGSGGHLSARGMAFRPVGAGQLTAVARLCAAIGPDASVVILDRLTADQFAQATRGMCDTPTAVMDHPAPATVGTVVSGIERAGRRPVLLAQDQSELVPYGGVPEQVVNLLTTQDARTLTPPARPWLIQYTVWMSQPTTAVAGGTISTNTTVLEASG